MVTNTGAYALINSIRSQLNELERVLDVGGLCSSSEAADILGVCPTTICTYLRQGKLHKVKKGNKTGIPLSDLLTIKKPSKVED